MKKGEILTYKKTKELRRGYTTGSCAAGATAAAISLLIKEDYITQISLMTPKGIPLILPVYNHCKGEDWASCSVQKDSGDDPDVTNGIHIFAKAEKIHKGIVIDGGVGVGRVTKKGLDQPVGAAAINTVPRKMIEEQVRKVCKDCCYSGGIKITISAPEGVNLAKKTFNPHLGIEGGISILGSSGIVEPMSEKALVDTILVEMKMKRANGADYLILTPGNYGQTFLKHEMNMDLVHAVKISNFIGNSLDFAVSLGFKGVLLVGHIGKLVKLAGGIMQTHSSYADCRMELLGVHSMLAGGSMELLQEILSCPTTEGALECIQEQKILKETIDSLLQKIHWYLQKRTGGTMETEIVLFSETLGLLGQTENVSQILENIKEGE